MAVQLSDKNSPVQAAPVVEPDGPVPVVELSESVELSEPEGAEMPVPDSKTAATISFIVKDIENRTNGAIRDLNVSVHEGCVTLSGRTSRFYYKQLATSVVLELEEKFQLQNGIAVY